MAYRAAIIISAVGILLSSTQVANAAGLGSSQADPRAKVVCQEVVPVGTIVAKELICLSRGAWNKSLGSRRDADDFSREFLQLKEPATAEMMQLGRADWGKLPQLQAKGKVPYLQLVRHTRELFRKGACTLPGQSATKFDILVNYGLKFDGGKVSRVLVEDSGCSHINALVGLVALARAERGDFNTADGMSNGWYADRTNLTLQ